MPGLTLNSMSERQRGAFRQYVKYRKGLHEDLFVDEGRKYATALFVQTAAIAPTRAQIAADVKALGWRVIKRGTADQWKGAALAKREKRRGRGAGAINDAMRATAMAAKATLSQMQQFVINKRAAARKYLASGWLGAVADLGGSLKTSSGAVDRARGGAFVRKGADGVEIVLWNRTPGIETMNDKKQFVAKAQAERAADMWAYILRKMGQARSRLKLAA